MKILLATIFLLAFTGFFRPWHWGANSIHQHRDTCYGDNCQIVFIDDSRYCPWWIDPELWWNQSCTGGLPPRLPVPEGLR